MKRTILFSLLIFGTSLGIAQNAAYRNQQMFSGGFPFPTVRVCIEPASGSPCTPLASIFSDAGLTQPLPNPFIGASDGTYTFFATIGVAYHIQITGTGINQTDIPYALLGNSSGGSGTITGVTTAIGSGLQGGSLTGIVVLSLQACATLQVLLSNGPGWNCSTINGTVLNSTSPSFPAFTNFCNGMNPTGIFQRSDATYGSYQGIDESTSPGGLLAGTPTFCFRTYFNDTSVPIYGRNSLVSIYHTWGNGVTTSTNADDAALRFRIESLASISGNQSNSRIQGIYGEVGIKGAPTGFGSGPDQGQDGIRIVIDDQHNSTLTTVSKGVTGDYTQSVATAVYGGCSICAIGVEGEITIAAPTNNNSATFAAFSAVTANGGSATNTNVVDYDAPYSSSGNFSSQVGLWLRGGYRSTDWGILNDSSAPEYLGTGGIFTGALSTTGGNVPVSGSLTGAEAVTTSQITPQSPSTVGNTGTAGVTTYTYVICAKDGNAGSACGSPASTTTGNATLNSSNFNNLQWTCLNSVSSYDVYKTVGGTTGFIANVPVGQNSSGTGWTATAILNRGANTACFFNDQGAVGDGTNPLPTPLNTTGGVFVAGAGVFSSVGPGSNNEQFVDGRVNLTTNQVADNAEWFNGPTSPVNLKNQGLRSTLIMSPPERILTNPFPPNFAPDWRLMPGSVHSTVCDATHIYCILLVKPAIIGSGGSIEGIIGAVLSGGDMSSGSLIMNDPAFIAPVGIPSVPGTVTCSGSGSTAYDFAMLLVVNLNSHTGGAAFGGPGAYAKYHVTGCPASGTTFTFPVPSGTLAGSLTPTEFEFGYSTTGANGPFWAQTAANLGCSPGVLGVATGTAYSCTIAGGAGSTGIPLASLQTNTFPFASDQQSGDPVDLSNPLVVTGTASVAISFQEQFLKMSLACQPTGHGSNNPNVLVYNYNGQEGTGTNDGMVNIYGDCGGYTGIAGGFFYEATQTPNGTLSHLQMSGGPSGGTAPFYCFILDGFGNGTGGASGSPREFDNITCALHGNGSTAGSADGYGVVQGLRARIQVSNTHGEIQNSNDVWYVTKGARAVFTGMEGSTGGNLIHCTASVGACTVIGACPQGTNSATLDRCMASATAVLDETVFPALTKQGYVAAPFVSGTQMLLTSAYTNATATPTTIMSFPIAANQTGTLHCHGLYKAAASGYFGLTVTGPTSPTTITYDFRKGTALSSGALTELDFPATGSAYPTSLGTTAVTTAATDMPWDFTVGFQNGTTAGTFTLQGFTVSTDTLTVEPMSGCYVQ